MGQAFYTSISGIKAGQNSINVVADNLANMNTIGFKQSSVTFSDVYYNTLSAGSGATTNLGGTNPKQIGVGTQTGAIARNFTTGSSLSTGVSTDMMLQGNGFFTVMNQDNQILYTKAGNFTLDEEGHLTLPSGYKLMGASSSFSTQSGNTPVKIPTMIETKTIPNTADIGTKDLSKLNNVSISTGTFKINVVDGGGTTTPVEITIADGDNLATIANKIQTGLNGVAAGHTVSLSGGKLQITPPAGETLKFESGTSNFVSATQLNDSNPTAGQPYSSKVLDYKQEIKVADNKETAQKYAGMTVYQDGSLEVKYSNGDKLKVVQDDNNNSVFQYTTAEGVVITGNDVTVPPQVATPANLQLQVASFINQNGLVGVGNNCFSQGANCGDAFYGTPNGNGFGALASGTLEGSNVDMTAQFADMIVAQRGIEANSRVFDTQNQIMKSLAYLGQ
ncbi:MAG: flagellar hook-basal body complex protein [Candidatus Gastranaerophilales bacterium]|nr:flagellar hook-basal body complex protein [Candidatus Gastranaerophilales bacterium]